MNMAVYPVCFILLIAGTTLCDPSNGTSTSCSGGSGPAQTIPMFTPCGLTLIQNYDLVQTIPVVVQVSSFMHMKCGRLNKFGISSGHRICRVPELTSEKRNSTIGQPLASTDVSAATQVAISTVPPTVVELRETLSKTTVQTTSPESSSTSVVVETSAVAIQLLPTTEPSPSTILSKPKTSSTTPTATHSLSESSTTPTTTHSASESSTTPTTTHSSSESFTTPTTTHSSSESSTYPTTTHSSSVSSTTPTTTHSSSESSTTLTTTHSSSESSTTLTTTHSSSESSTTFVLTPTQTSTSQPVPTSSTGQPDTTKAVGIYKVFVTDHRPKDKRILWADLQGSDSMQFSEFLRLDGKPSDVTFDPVDQMLYWSDYDNKKIWRADLFQRAKEEVTHQNGQDKPLGIVIAVWYRHLYCAYESSGWINRVRLGNPDSEERFLEGLNKPKALTIDEQNGYLYWSRHEGIERIQFNEIGSMGDIEVIIELQAFSKMYGLTISPDGTRLFFCDENTKQALYLDIGASEPVSLIGSNGGFVLRDVNLGPDGVLYWLQSNDKRILEMTDYQRSTEYIIRAESSFGNPQRMHIAQVNQL